MDFVVVQTNTSRIYHKYFLMNSTFNKHNTSTFDDFFFFWKILLTKTVEKDTKDTKYTYLKM